MNYALPTDEIFCNLHKFRRERDLAHVKCLQKHVCGIGLDTQTVLKCHFVPMFVDCGSITAAQHAFNKLITHDEWSWRYLIKGYTDCEDLDHAFELFQRMQIDCINPSEYTLTTLLKACAGMKSDARGRELHLEIVKKGCQDDIYVTTTLVDMYMEFGSVADACAVFNGSLVQDVFLWTTLLGGLGNQGLHDEALECLEEMQLGTVPPDPITYICSLKSCSSLGASERGLIIHNNLIKQGFETDISVFRALVSMYAKFGWLSEAKNLLLGVTSRCLSLWNALISGYSEHGLGEEALECMKEMKLDGVCPDEVTFICILKACAGPGYVHVCQEIHNQILKLGLEGLNFVGSILVDVYIKCGWLEEAHEVFNGMATHDVVSWTTLIAGYVEYGLYDKAMLCLEEMQIKGTSPDIFTFLCILNACDNSTDAERGLYAHFEIVKRGMDTSSLISSSLIRMYAQFCMFREARAVLDKLPVKDTTSWDGLTGGLVEHGCGEAAMDCIDQMQINGVSISVTTVINGLKACRSLESIEKCFELHTKSAKCGLDTDSLLENNLLDVYSKCGYLLEAQNIFDGMKVHSTVSWSALIRGYMEHGHDGQVLDHLEQMQLSGVAEDAVTLICSLNACSCTGALSRGRVLHNIIIIRGVEGDLLAGSALVDMYAKCGSLSEAEEVLHQLRVRNVVSWTAVLAAHAEQAHIEDLFRCFEQMQVERVSPNAITYVILVRACMDAILLGKGGQIHSEILKAGFDVDSSVCSALVSHYASYGLLIEAQEVFDKIVTLDVSSWNVLLRGYLEHGKIERVLECLEEMQKDGISPDNTTYVYCLRACHAMKATNLGQNIHSDVVKRGIELNPPISTCLVNMYIKHQKMIDAQNLFYQLPVIDTVTWTSVLVGHFEKGLGEEALRYFEEMQEEGVFADVVTWNAMIHGCAQQGDSERAFIFWSRMLEEGVLPNAATFLSIIKACCNTFALSFGKRIFAQCCKDGAFKEAEMNMATSLVEMFGRCGSMANAQQVFDAMPQRDVPVWNALMRGYSRQGDGEHALKLLKRMAGEGLQPDSFTFLCVLMMCNHAGLLDEAQEFYESMSEEYGISASLDHHNCMTDLVGRAGHLNDTLALIRQMPFQSNAAVVNTLLSACQKWGSVEVGKQVFDHAVSRLRETRDAGVFVLMSNIYAADVIQSPLHKRVVSSNLT